MIKYIFIFILTLIVLTGCKSDFYERNWNLTLNFDENEHFSDTTVNQAFSCAPKLISLESDNEVNVRWGPDPDGICGTRRETYTVSKIDDTTYKVSDEELGYYIQIYELDNDVYAVKEKGANPFILYIPSK